MINCRPLGLCKRQQMHDNVLSCVTPYSLMYNTLSPSEYESISTLSKDEGEINISSIMLKIRTHVSRILNRYLDIVLHKFRPIHNQKVGFNPILLKHRTPVLFRYRSTGVPYKATLFYLELVDLPNRSTLRNSRCMFIRAVKDGRVKRLSIFKEDIIP